MLIITCKYCGKEVEAERKTKKYCSVLCATRYRTNLPKERICIECGTSFPIITNADSRRKFCSQKCAKRHYGKPTNGLKINTCHTCGNEFKAKSKKKMCSVCYARAYNGYPKERKCRKCGNVFHVLTQADANRQYCSQECSQTASKEITKAWIDKHPDANHQYKLNHLARHPNKWKKNAKQERLDTLELLGGKCIVCGVNNPKWLHVDYIPTTRNETHRHPRHLAYIRKNKDNFRLLCANHHYELTLTGMIEGTDITQ